MAFIAFAWEIVPASAGTALAAAAGGWLLLWLMAATLRPWPGSGFRAAPRAFSLREAGLRLTVRGPGLAVRLLIAECLFIL
jgi:hypothetical protein